MNLPVTPPMHPKFTAHKAFRGQHHTGDASGSEDGGQGGVQNGRHPWSTQGGAIKSTCTRVSADQRCSTGTKNEAHLLLQPFNAQSILLIIVIYERVIFVVVGPLPGGALALGNNSRHCSPLALGNSRHGWPAACWACHQPEAGVCVCHDAHETELQQYSHACERSPHPQTNQQGSQ